MINKYKENVKFIKKENLEINKTEKKIDKLKKELEGFDEPNFQKLLSEQKVLEANRTLAKNDYDETNKDLELLKNREKELEKQLENEVTSTKELNEIKLKIQLAEEIENLFNEAKSQHLESIKSDLQINSQDIYTKKLQEKKTTNQVV